MTVEKSVGLNRSVKAYSNLLKLPNLRERGILLVSFIIQMCSQNCHSLTSSSGGFIPLSLPAPKRCSGLGFDAAAPQESSAQGARLSAGGVAVELCRGCPSCATLCQAGGSHRVTGGRLKASKPAI